MADDDQDFHDDLSQELARKALKKHQENKASDSEDTDSGSSPSSPAADSGSDDTARPAWMP